MTKRVLIGCALAGALLGVILSALSTYDFARHLDRQVHAIHCGIGPSKPGGDSGCKVAMMSPYSSVLRGAVWGGVPISLPGMAMFAFLLFAGAELLLTRRLDDRGRTAILAGAAAVPVAVSLVMGGISAFSLGAACTVCIGIYLASALCFAGALGLWLTAPRAAPVLLDANAQVVGRARGGPAGSVEPRTLGVAAAIAFGFVALPVIVYVAAAPDHSRFAKGCGQLESSADPHGVLVPIGPAAPGAKPAIEILDPLCPACAAFEQRLASSGYAGRLARRALLFPLESGCNWMVENTVHPGACTVSEAVMCAGARADEVLAWAFRHQQQIMDATRKDPAAARRMVHEAFPRLAQCVGSPPIRARLNRALRWAVKNHLAVLTPQLFLGDVKVCDEDLDLGLEYTLKRMGVTP